jgi:hypothetical protein
MIACFGDLDGVLNGSETREPPSLVHPGIFLNPERVARLNRICERTGAVVVLSTSWRHRLHDDGRPITLDELRAAYAAAGFTGSIMGATPDLRPPGSPPKSVHTPRSDEIRAWVKEHRPAAFVVLDDYDDAGVDGRFVRTDPRCGLTDADVERAVDLLGAKS